MTTPEMEALARRAVACKGWRWMPGMLVLHLRAGHHSDEQRVIFEGEVNPYTDPLPDLSDAATVGCLADLAGDLAGWVWVAPSPPGTGKPWAAWFTDGDTPPEVIGTGDTRVAALVAALEAAS